MTDSIRPPSFKLANVIAASMISLALGGCGGGGGGGGGPSFTPRPPPTPTPTPTGLISAPARATTGGGPAPVFATPGGPNFTTGHAAGTEFPILQSAMTWNGPRVEADTSRNAQGGTATVDSGHLKVTYDANPSSGHADLDWTRVGYWVVQTDWYVEPGANGAFVIGYETPTDAVPTTGTATYSGRAEGSVFYPLDSQGTNLRLSGGISSFTADFGARTLRGSLTGLLAGSSPWNDVAFNSTVAGNRFSGTTWVTSAPAGIASLGIGATGTLEGKFFGPGAQEAGAVWTLFDGTKAAIGTLSGKQGSPWDY